MNPRISVVMPLYNAEQFLAKVLESVFHQTYPAHEVIVIDDGSTDSSPEILKRYGDRVRTRRIPNSGSPSAPLNVALGMVTGDYVAFLDNDDFWFKNKLERHADFIRKYPETGVFCSDFAVRRPSKNSKLQRNFDLVLSRNGLNFDNPLQGDVFRMLLKENFAGISSNVVIRKDVVDKVGGFDDGKKYSEDYDYLLRCAQLTGFLLISDLLVFKKTHDSNITNDLIRMNTKHVNVLLKVRPALEDVPEYRASLRECDRAIANHLYWIGHDYFNQGRVREAFSSYLETFKVLRTFPSFVAFLWVVFRKGVRLFIIRMLSKKNYERIKDASRGTGHG